MKSRGELNTEKRNEVSTSIDSMSIKDILQTINEGRLENNRCCENSYSKN